MFVAATFVCSHMLRNKTESITQNAQQQQKTWNTSETYRKKGKRAREKQGRKHNSTDGSVSWCVSFEMYRMFWFWCITALASCYQKWSVRSVCSFGQSFASFQIETFLSHRHTHTFPQISAFDHYVSEGVIKSDPTEFREMSLKRRNFLEIQSRPKIGSFVRNRIHAVCLSSWHIQLCKYLGHCDRELFPTGLYLFRWKFSLLECWSHFIIAISIYMHFPCTYLSNE